MKLKKIAQKLAITLLACLLLSLPVYAERLTDLYTLSSLVKDTSGEQRALVANELLKKLLVKVSGTIAVLEKMPPEDFSTRLLDQENEAEFLELYSEYPGYELWKELTSAQHLINQFSYTASNESVTLSNGEVVKGQLLELTFDEAGVKSLLHRLNTQVWDANRPKVLFWVALESRKGRTLITPNSNAPLSNVLTSLSEERGIPYQLPDFNLHSATDTLFSDIWGGFSQQIITASAPYKPDAIAVGKIKASGSNWRVEWRLFTGMGSVWHNAQVRTLREALQEGVEFSAEELSKRYASQAGQGAGTYQVMISNIKHLQDYAAITAYLNGLALTSQVRVVQSADQRILFELGLRGGLDQLKANLALDGRLNEESFFGLQQSSNYAQQVTTDQPDKVKTEQADAYFRWQAN
ncbi:hypothetical protein GCM10007878_11980 [Marinospirillum insulare]|uniref:DUF2066 domain-containing protein n=1 Tax=Marinospirillum insulare TaxID=217169 RepID=A0ABQ5ZXF1_9GAMM|nr:hypothetical protein GCM10007878_11980 [Marinospirillum insulare]